MLLDVCCAPCCLPIIEHLLAVRPGEEVVLFFDGPNIFPQAEHEKRLAETKKIAALYSLKLCAENYEHELWLQTIKKNLPKPPESYPENGERCQACFEFRLERTAVFAKENNFRSFATTLSVSCHKDTGFINNYGHTLAQRLGLNYIAFNLDAHAAHRKGLELSKKYNIYRQKYCGCEFSLPKGGLR